MIKDWYNETYTWQCWQQLKRSVRDLNPAHGRMTLFIYFIYHTPQWLCSLSSSH